MVNIVENEGCAESYSDTVLPIMPAAAKSQWFPIDMEYLNCIDCTAFHQGAFMSDNFRPFSLKLIFKSHCALLILQVRKFQPLISH